MRALLISILMIILINVPSAWGYTNLTPAQVHSRLVNGDTLLLLDVRETSEYILGHIAEPAGRLPITPALMPYNSGVLAAEYNRLPRKIDIVVYCRSGSRSAASSAFLESRGFSRILNMTGGFSSWGYESRGNGFGDHSGKWVHAADLNPVTIFCADFSDTSNITISPEVVAPADSVYFELHLASSQAFVPPDVPLSQIDGLYRVTALDKFGVPMFAGDSLLLAQEAKLYFSPNCKGDEITEVEMTVFVPGEGWRSVPFTYNSAFHREENILRRWYNMAGTINSGLTISQTQPETFGIYTFPNPFNNSVKIIAPQSAILDVFDIKGRWIKRLDSRTWIPSSSAASGIYYITIKSNKQIITKSVLYIK